MQLEGMFDVVVAAANGDTRFDVQDVIEVHDYADKIAFETDEGSFSFYFKQHIIGFDLIKKGN